MKLQLIPKRIKYYRPYRAISLSLQTLSLALLIPNMVCIQAYALGGLNSGFNNLAGVSQGVVNTASRVTNTAATAATHATSTAATSIVAPSATTAQSGVINTTNFVNNVTNNAANNVVNPIISNTASNINAGVNATNLLINNTAATTNNAAVYSNSVINNSVNTVQATVNNTVNSLQSVPAFINNAASNLNHATSNTGATMSGTFSSGSNTNISAPGIGNINVFGQNEGGFTAITTPFVDHSNRSLQININDVLTVKSVNSPQGPSSDNPYQYAVKAVPKQVLILKKENGHTTFVALELPSIAAKPASPVVTVSTRPLALPTKSNPNSPVVLTAPIVPTSLIPVNVAHQPVDNDPVDSRLPASPLSGIPALPTRGTPNAPIIVKTPLMPTPPIYVRVVNQPVDINPSHSPTSSGPDIHSKPVDISIGTYPKGIPGQPGLPLHPKLYKPRVKITINLDPSPVPGIPGLPGLPGLPVAPKLPPVNPTLPTLPIPPGLPGPLPAPGLPNPIPSGPPSIGNTPTDTPNVNKIASLPVLDARNIVIPFQDAGNAVSKNAAVLATLLNAPQDGLQRARCKVFKEGLAGASVGTNIVYRYKIQQQGRIRVAFYDEFANRFAITKKGHLNTFSDNKENLITECACDTTAFLLPHKTNATTNQGQLAQ